MSEITEFDHRKEVAKPILILGIVCLLIIAWYALKSCHPQPVRPSVTTFSKPDTVYFRQVLHDTVEVIQTEYRTVPKTVYVYKADTARRKEIETDTLVSGLTMKGNDIKIETITPAGITEVSDYKLPEQSLMTATIDHKGNIELLPDAQAMKRKKRRERWRKIGNWALIIGSFVLGKSI